MAKAKSKTKAKNSSSRGSSSSKKKSAKRPSKVAVTKSSSNNKVRYSRSDKAIFRSDESGDVLVMLINNPDSFYRIDAWAARVWQLIDGKNNLQTIVNKIVDESKFEEKFVSKNVQEIIKDFLKHEIIQSVGGK